MITMFYLILYVRPFYKSGVACVKCILVSPKIQAQVLERGRQFICLQNISTYNNLGGVSLLRNLSAENTFRCLLVNCNMS